ncbi:MAG: hypothetical protein IPK04_20805 [Bdellovibrionales bacterium]|nr:hypothetical protein [Bdellovibrionales bacterium]
MKRRFSAAFLFTELMKRKCKNKRGKMNPKSLLSLIYPGAFVLAFSPSVGFGAANTSAIPAVVLPSSSQPADIDQTITNSKVRAELGSKSKWSVRNTLTYQGGTMNTPLDEARPDYRSASLDTTNAVYFTGEVATKYGLMNGDSLNLGVGITVLKPFNRTIEEATSRNSNFNISTPFIEYNKAYKVGSVQMVSTGKFYYATEKNDVDVIGKFGVIRLSQTFLREIGTRLTGGLQFIADTNIYKNSDSVYLAEGSKSEIPRNNNIIGAFPYAEYAFNDRYAVRTVFGLFQFKNTLADYTYRQLEPYQSLGVGISLSRDFYLYPNLQFAPKDIRADRTNVGLTANINLF